LETGSRTSPFLYFKEDPSLASTAKSRILFLEFVIIVPCYNEANRWNSEYWQGMLGIPGSHWIFVDDGSTDETADCIARTITNGSAAALLMERNAGKAEAVRFGMLNGLKQFPSATAVGFMDADGAFEQHDVKRVFDGCRSRFESDSHIDAVWAARVALAGRNIRRSSTRHYLGRLVATYVSSGQKNMPYDTQCGLKLFRPSEDMKTILSTCFKTRWLLELETLVRWQSSHGRSMTIWEEPLETWFEVPGSKITKQEIVRILLELIKIKRLQTK
jgi:dolichyl-phosphate beta-glucosyltransferase